MNKVVPSRSFPALSTPTKISLSLAGSAASAAISMAAINNRTGVWCGAGYWDPGMMVKVLLGLMTIGLLGNAVQLLFNRWWATLLVLIVMVPVLGAVGYFISFGIWFGC